MKSSAHRPRGLSLTWVIGSLVGSAVLVGVVALPMFRNGDSEARADAVLHTVERTLFEHSVVEPGEIESANNVEVRCEVQSRNSTGTVILEIVPAGTVVQPGDILIKFDGSALENERTAQMIVSNNSEALLIGSQNAFDTAEIAKKEYLEGTFAQEEQLIQSEVFVAEENLRRAEEYARYSEKLAARGFVTAEQLEADKFAVEKARKDLGAANTKLKVLRDFTKEKMIKTLDAAIETAKAKLQADKNTHQLDIDKLKLIEAQLEKCVVRAPTAGKVIYANESDRRGNQEVIIQEGAVIRERQVVIRLPDLTQMQVKAKINESRIGFIRVGMPVTITLDAFPDLRLDGVVKQVDEYPVPPGWMSTTVKQYLTFVTIKDATPGVRPGLTANVEIHVDQVPDAVTVPVQALYENKGQYYCLVNEGEKQLARWVDVGASNDKYVVITAGINPGDEVIVNPDPFAEYVEFPAPPPDKIGRPKVLLAKAAETSTAAPPGGNGLRPNSAKSDKADGGERGEGKGGSGKGGKGGGKNRDPLAMVRETFDRYDANKDGVLSQEEMPSERRDRMILADANGDGKVDRGEMTASMQRMRASAGPNGGGPNAPAGSFSGGGQ